MARFKLSLDLDSDRRLSSLELRRFAELTGFEGSEAEWQEEFQMTLSGFRRLFFGFSCRNDHFHMVLRGYSAVSPRFYIEPVI